MDIVELNNTYESIVQLVEHVLAKNKVVGSMPIALSLCDAVRRPENLPCKKIEKYCR